MNWKTSLKSGPFTEVQAKQLHDLLPGLDPNQIQWLNGYLAGIGVFLHDNSVETQVSEQAVSLPSTEPIWILFGTHTGNSENLAHAAAKRLQELGRETKVQGMDVFKTKNLKTITQLLIIVSTDGEGDPPVQAEDLLSFLQGKRAPQLNHLSYSVLALGDSSYTDFCQTGKDFDAILAEKGGQRLKERIDCDVDYEDNYEAWIEDVSALFTLETTPDLPFQTDTPASVIGLSTAQSPATYTKKNPFPATVLEKINLNGRDSNKETVHLELDLADSQLRYQAGDALGVYALNNEQLVDEILQALKFSGQEIVSTHLGDKDLKSALLSDYELTILTSNSLKKYAELSGNDNLLHLDKQALHNYLYGRDMLDLIQEETYEFTPQEFVSILRKNMPRMYSIASSQEEVGDEVHILVSAVRYTAHNRQKEGQCSSFIADRIQIDGKVKVFIDPNSQFKLPEKPQTPIIMVGPGTGVAPFRSFIQERDTQENPGKSWLFFGDQHFTTDFLYQTEWLNYKKEGLLTYLDVAFSRDQEEKIYVQHKMLERGEELFQWLEEGAHFYVCGDKDHMAKDVNAALLQIIQRFGNKSEDQAKTYIKELQKNKRYQTDVY